MADIYGANLYNRYLQAQPEVNITTMVPGPQSKKKGQKVSSAKSCSSILVCTGVYTHQVDVPADQSGSVTETVFHGHRDFQFDPKLVEASHVVSDVNEAVELVFQKENWK